MRRRSGGGDGSTASRSTRDANRATVADRSTSLTPRTEGPHRPRCCAIIALNPKIGVYTATACTVSRCDTRAATGLPMDTPDIAIAVDRGCSQRTTARTSDTARVIPATLASADDDRVEAGRTGRDHDGTSCSPQLILYELQYQGRD